MSRIERGDQEPTLSDAHQWAQLAPDTQAALEQYIQACRDALGLEATEAELDARDALCLDAGRTAALIAEADRMMDGGSPELRTMGYSHMRSAMEERMWNAAKQAAAIPRQNTG